MSNVMWMKMTGAVLDDILRTTNVVSALRDTMLTLRLCPIKCAIMHPAKTRRHSH
jgi:hypothetical protein